MRKVNNVSPAESGANLQMRGRVTNSALSPQRAPPPPVITIIATFSRLQLMLAGTILLQSYKTLLED